MDMDTLKSTSAAQKGIVQSLRTGVLLATLGGPQVPANIGASVNIVLDHSTEAIIVESAPGGETWFNETAMPGRADHLTNAEFVRPASVRLVFEDGLEGVWTFHQLCLNMEDMKTSTITTGPSGTSLQVRSKRNELVDLDSSSLRAAVDDAYANDLEAAFVRLRGPLEHLATNATSLPKS